MRKARATVELFSARYTQFCGTEQPCMGDFLFFPFSGGHAERKCQNCVAAAPRLPLTASLRMHFPSVSKPAWLPWFTLVCGLNWLRCSGEFVFLNVIEPQHEEYRQEMASAALLHSPPSAMTHVCRVQVGCMPATFSGDATDPVDQQLPVIVADPSDACSDLRNAAIIPGAVVLIERGDCWYYDQAKRAATAGAAGMSPASPDATNPPRLSDTTAEFSRCCVGRSRDIYQLRRPASVCDGIPKRRL